MHQKVNVTATYGVISHHLTIRYKPALEQVKSLPIGKKSIFHAPPCSQSRERHRGSSRLRRRWVGRGRAGAPTFVKSTPPFAVLPSDDTPISSISLLPTSQFKLSCLRAGRLTADLSDEIRRDSKFNPIFAVDSEDSSESWRCKNPHVLLFIRYNHVIRRNPHLAVIATLKTLLQTTRARCTSL